jgi:SAM-dependent methyltransferase
MLHNERGSLSSVRLENIRRVYRDSVIHYDHWMDCWARDIAPPYLLGQYVKILQEATDGARRVLEVGVGTGRNIPLYRKVSEFNGIDITPEVLDVARKRITPTQFSGHCLSVMDSESLEFEDSSFDVVVSTFHLCVVPEMENAINEMIRVLRKGGLVFIFEYQYAENKDIRAAQEMLAETFTESGLVYKGGPVVVWQPTRDIIGAFRRRSAVINIEKIERAEQSVMLAKVLLLVRKQ